MKKQFFVGAITALIAASEIIGTTQAFASNTSTPTSVSYGFTQSGDHPDVMVENAIKSAHSTLDIAVYSLSNYDIVDSIRDAAKRGVKVRIITDRAESQNRSEARELKYLSKFHVPIKINTHSGLMHLKIASIDQEVAMTGSFNWTKSASTVNDEVVVIAHDTKMAQDFHAEFNQMWNDSSRFANWNG